MQKSDSKRKIVTDEHREEARRLRAIWDQRKPELMARGVGTQEKFGARYDIGNQAATGFFLNGKVALSLKAAHGFARGLGCQIEDFSPRLARTVHGRFDEQLAERFSLAAMTLARDFDLVPMGREREVLYHKLRDQIRVASRPALQLDQQPTTNRHQTRQTEHGRSPGKP